MAWRRPILVAFWHGWRWLCWCWGPVLLQCRRLDVRCSASFTRSTRGVAVQVMLELTPRLRMRRPDTQLHETSCALQPMSPPSLICADQSTVSTADNRFDAAHTDQSAILEEMLLQQVSALLTVRQPPTPLAHLQLGLAGCHFWAWCLTQR